MVDNNNDHKRHEQHFQCQPCTVGLLKLLNIWLPVSGGRFFDVGQFGRGAVSGRRRVLIKIIDSKTGNGSKGVAKQTQRTD